MEKTLRVAILAGEASGDILGAGLMRSLSAIHPDISFSGIGGPEMERAGLDSRVPMERLSVMGLVEPLKRLPELLAIRKSFYQTLRDDPPDVFIGIDSPDFNLDLEKKLKGLNIPTVHYVSPSVWAWRQNRIKKIKQAVNLMLTLFPFEEKFYKDNGVPVCCVGHPLADELPLQVDVDKARLELALPADRKILALLPGSREGEVSRLGPVFLETAKLCLEKWPALTIVIPSANEARHTQLRSMLDTAGLHEVILLEGNSRKVMAAADCVLMASGTAALEGMLLKKPMVVAYKMAPLSYAIISRMLKAPYISLPNLLADKALVPELLQDAANPADLLVQINKLLTSDESRQEVISTWQSIHQSLRRNASDTAAKAVLELCAI
jgi:lipid-A-disaccharide synthase